MLRYADRREIVDVNKTEISRAGTSWGYLRNLRKIKF